MSLSFSMTGADLSAALRQLVETEVTAAARRRIETAEAGQPGDAQETIAGDKTGAVAARSTQTQEASR